MSEQPEKLVRCFRAVFPDLAPDEVLLASVQTVPQWDSLATVTLVALMQREFNLEIDPLDVVDCDSFESMRAYLRERGALA